MITGNLRMLAHDAHLEATAAAAELAAHERTNKIQLIGRKLSNLFAQPVTVTPTTQDYRSSPIVTADDLRFTLVTEGDLGTDLVLLDVCDGCGHETHSDFISTLPHLGELLAHFTPATDHECR